MQVLNTSSANAVQDRVVPRVWLVLGDKRGDNAQVETLRDALGWPCEHKFIQPREPYVVGKPRVRASLYHIDPARSDPLAPPWPDLILTIGRRPSMVALWIRDQSGGRTKIVLLGKPSGSLRGYDLIVPSAEAQLPPLPHVLPITLPLMRVNQHTLTAAVPIWQPRFAPLPRPLIGMLVGGPTGPFIFNQAVVKGLLDSAAMIIHHLGGTPYFTTSRRTPAAVGEALQAGLPPGAELFHWTPDARDNPYLGLLSLADGFVVTGDSVSMMVEIARLGKPLAIFPLPCSRLGALDQWRRSATRWLFTAAPDSRTGWLRRRLALAAYHTGIITQTRDFKAFHRMLIERGLAVPMGAELLAPTQPAPDDLAVVVARVKALMEFN